MEMNAYHASKFISGKKGRDEIKYDPCSGRPSTSTTQENIDQVGNVICKDCR